jgi:hypothetical protein
MASKKRKLRPYGTKWVDVFESLGECRELLSKNNFVEARVHAKLALDAAGKHCHHPSRARSSGLTLERTIRTTILEPMNAVDYKDEKDYVLGAIDLVTDIVEREAGLAIYKANMRRDVAILVAGYKDETTRSVHEKFEKFVNSAKKRFSKKGS